MRRQKQNTKEDSELVAFKLDDENRAKLNALAGRLDVKRNLAARNLVIDSLNGHVDMQDAIIFLQQQIFMLREELALVAEAVLTHAGKLSSSDAKRWVDQNIQPASSPEDGEQP